MGIFNTPVQQPADQYYRQSLSNLAREDAGIQRAMERDQLLERGRSLAGFIRSDRRADGGGFVWERQRGATWPAQMPESARAVVEQACAADRAGRASLSVAETQYQLWQQQHPSATPERARLRFEELTEDVLPAAERAAHALDEVLTQAAQLVETIEQWRQVEQAAPGRRAAAEKAYQNALATIDTELQVARMTATRVGVRV